MDLLGDKQTITGILSFGSRHVSHESPQKVQQEDNPVRWEDAWIETKCTEEELEEAGVRPGIRVITAKSSLTKHEILRILSFIRHN